MEDATLPIPKLPNDVIVEILTWLPVKPLLRFRCVCKSWRTLISSKQFVTAHLQNLKSDPDFTTQRLIVESRGNLQQCLVNCALFEPVPELFDLSCPFQSECVRVVGSCNGLVCLFLDQKDLVLLNPSTRIWKKLPHVEGNFRRYYVSGSGFGFGFDKASDDYKVAAFCDNHLDSSGDMIVQVYSLRNDEWKRIKNFAKANWEIYDYASFVNGKLYWPACLGDHESVWDLVSFDLEKEEAELVPLPSHVKRCCYALLGMFGGLLYVLCGHQASADVWMMDGCSVEKDKWAKVVTITTDRLKLHYIKKLCVKNGLVLWFWMTPTKIFIFDAEEDCQISYPDLTTKFRHRQSSSGTYFESLVSPLG